MFGYLNNLIKRVSQLGANERSWAILGLLVAAYFSLFLHLDAINLYRWDESLNAVHAYEMSQSGNLLVRTFLGNPETWDTKPPLLTWLQAFFLRTLGYHELSIRLPSALATLGIILLILHFFARDLMHFSGGVFASLVLLMMVEVSRLQPYALKGVAIHTAKPPPDCGEPSETSEPQSSERR